MSEEVRDRARRRRSKRAVALFVAVTLVFAAAVGVSRCMEAESLRQAEQP